jgi:very-short-patch-repair endonuclease
MQNIFKNITSTETFIKRSKAIHSERYDYSKTQYESLNSNVIIGCPEHGDFSQRASNHLQGKGCNKCAILTRGLDSMLRSVGLENGLTIHDYVSAFAKKSEDLHGDKYDYSESKFDFETKKISIKCRLHGFFFQRPSAHLGSAGCKACADIDKGKERSKKHRKSFLNDAMKVHGNKYDYSKSIYEKSSIKIEIICSEHGSFFQRPNNHLRGVGCPVCGTQDMANKQRKTMEEFLEEANDKHGESYDYSLVDYVTSHKHVKIVCPEHGVFEQSPAGHLGGRGCVWCAAKKNADKQRKDASSFIKEAQEVHGKRYDYTRVSYKNNRTSVEILCVKHGPFYQIPTKHTLSKQGCPSCANRDMDSEKFIERAKDIHGDRYDYSRAEYKLAKSNVSIICPIHGVFEQVAQHHLAGSGCIACVDTLNSRGSARIEDWLTQNNIPFQREKKFATLTSERKSSYKLRWDFYLKETKTLIEFDGEQHFRPVSHWGGEKQFRIIQGNDERKNNWAIDYGFQLIRISYLEFDEIEQILSSQLFVT